MYARVVHVTPENLGREEWDFWMDATYGPKIYLDRYAALQKPTARHKYRVVRFWSRLSKRDNTIDNPMINDDIWNEAKQLFANLVKQAEVIKP